ncbi:hypothetical protein CERSUDRAFT_89937 [Gelatoporia subvermispora B]|uniref:Uncharacterized protein n=1 Tax=Ceriporiopsis subvermispora (strain B) TaxID=914234 RepID=M2RSG0_CERS8|nr:hypothetical protein CERSUDRAFT_89937 [Gelatoporia subvermispora B]
MEEARRPCSQTLRDAQGPRRFPVHTPSQRLPPGTDNHIDGADAHTVPHALLHSPGNALRYCLQDEHPSTPGCPDASDATTECTVRAPPSETEGVASPLNMPYRLRKRTWTLRRLCAAPRRSATLRKRRKSGIPFAIATYFVRGASEPCRPPRRNRAPADRTRQGSNVRVRNGRLPRRAAKIASRSHARGTSPPRIDRALPAFRATREGGPAGHGVSQPARRARHSYQGLPMQLISEPYLTLSQTWTHICDDRSAGLDSEPRTLYRYGTPTPQRAHGCRRTHARARVVSCGQNTTLSCQKPDAFKSSVPEKTGAVGMASQALSSHTAHRAPAKRQHAQQHSQRSARPHWCDPEKHGPFAGPGRRPRAARPGPGALIGSQFAAHDARHDPLQHNVRRQGSITRRVRPDDLMRACAPHIRPWRDPASVEAWPAVYARVLAPHGGWCDGRPVGAATLAHCGVPPCPERAASSIGACRQPRDAPLPSRPSLAEQAASGYDGAVVCGAARAAPRAQGCRAV